MKIIMFGICTTFCLFLTNCKVYANEIIYLSVTLTVLDAVTQQPLEGIEVNIINVIFYSRPLRLLIFPIDTSSGFLYHMYNYKTNANGIVEIPQFVYSVDGYHSLYDQKIILNLEFRNTYMPTEEQAERFNYALLYDEDSDVFFRPNSGYKVGVIYCYIRLLDFKQIERTIPYLSLKLNKYDVPEEDMTTDHFNFNIAHENIIFNLEHFIEQE